MLVEQLSISQPTVPLRPTLKQLLEQVSSDYNLLPTSLQSDRRQKIVVWARHEFCYRAAMETTKSIVKIGLTINRDHSTVLNAIARHAERNNLPMPRGMNPDYKKRVTTKPQ